MDRVEDYEARLKLVITATYTVLIVAEAAFLLYSHWDDPEVKVLRARVSKWWGRVRAKARLDQRVKRENPYVQWEAWNVVNGQPGE